MQLRHCGCVILLLGLGPGLVAQGPTSPATAALVSKYAAALQKRDYKTVISMTSAYQADIARIKAQNPQVLWPKLLDQYYQSKIDVFSQQAGYWQGYFESLLAPGGDPAQGIRAGAALLPPSAKWRVTETRHQLVRNQWNLREFDQGIAYVSVSYPVWQDAPRLGNKLLDQTILQFTVDIQGQVVLSTSRISAADTFKQEPMQISSVELGENYAGMTLRYGVVGGVPPFTCRVRFGSLQTQQDCSALSQGWFTSNFEWNKLHERMPLPASISVRDGKNHTDEVALTLPAFPPVQLNIYPLWTYCWMRDPWFQRGETGSPEFQACKKPVSQLGGPGPNTARENPSVAENASAPAGTAGSAVPNPPTPSSAAGAESAPANQASPCGDYDGCVRMAENAMRSSNWTEALNDLQSASAQRPTAGRPWNLRATTLLAMGRLQEAPAAWDKALSLGYVIPFPVCHERTLQPCERGFLTISSTQVSFTTNQPQFGVSPSEAVPKGVLNNTLTNHVSFGIQASGKSFNFDFIPFGVQCQIQLMVKCGAAGLAQQLAVAKYITQALPKLVSGSPNATPPAPTAPPSGGGSPAPAAASTCEGAADLGYAIQLRQHVYKVQALGPANSRRIPVFFDEQGVRVTDLGLLQELVEAYWTRENVVVDPMSRNGASRVSNILGDSKALEGYSIVQDSIARIMVEAVEAGFTGGTSLAKAVPNYTIGVVKREVLNAPKILLNRTAQQGLAASIDQYRKMEAVPLPPATATLLKAEDLAAVKGFYIHGQALELAYSPLAVSFMPKSGNALAEDLVKSAFGELLGGPALSGGGNDVLTLKYLWDMQTEVGALAKGVPALVSFSQSVSSMNVTTDSIKRTILTLSTSSAAACSSAPANAATGPANFDAFYNKLRSVAARRDQAGLRELMSERFEWALDGYVTRDQALSNISQIITWPKFWQSAALALAKPAQVCKPHYCNNRPGFETFTKTPFPLEMMFETGPDKQWHWSAVLGD